MRIYLIPPVDVDVEEEVAGESIVEITLSVYWILRY